MNYTISASYGGHDDSTKLASEGDVESYLVTLLEAAINDPDNTCAWLYIDGRQLDEDGLTDHEMRIGIVPDASAWTLGFTDLRGSMYVKGRDSGQEEVRLFMQGHDESFPADSLISVDIVKSAIAEALRTGQRPENVLWSPTREGAQQ
ncbi:Imm1 family immunity protein [Kribbella sp. NPDC051587]|uniref:Imm1 family immunity protein n=1 Tax=Kribbella sp. NPDC051587 TaxID=3364119 RepID=UPI0037BD734C